MEYLYVKCQEVDPQSNEVDPIIIKLTYFDIDEVISKKKKHKLCTFQSHFGSLHVKCQEVDSRSNKVDPKSDYHKTYVF